MTFPKTYENHTPIKQKGYFSNLTTFINTKQGTQPGISFTGYPPRVSLLRSPDTYLSSLMEL